MYRSLPKARDIGYNTEQVGNSAGLMGGIAEIVPVAHDTLGDRVHAQLRDMLICGKFAPGEKVTLRSLARAIGTSPMPVRDALKQLMVDQAIELLPNRAFRVPLMTRERFVELRDIRIVVEGLAAERAAQVISKSEVDEAARLSKAFNRCCDSADPDPSELIVLNKELHFTVYGAAQMPALLQIIEGLWTQIGPVLNLDVRRGSERINKSIPCEHHERLVAALRAGDPRESRAALTADLNSAADYILNQDGFAD